MNNRHHLLFLLFGAITFTLLFVSPDFRDVVVRNTQMDTIGHAVGFFALAGLLSIFFKLPTLPLTIALISYAALSELAQYYLGFRNGEFKDFIADAIGILLFMLLKSLWIVFAAMRAKTEN